ncbi:MAG: flagellar hook-basal body protein [Clostridiales bacterium]|nr:flagellar hook-basal body protein [Clostridiales bacterium]
MNTAFYTGASGLMAFQTKMNEIGNNIANVNTNGYRPVKTAFSDLLYSEMYIKSAQLLTGHGVKAAYSGIDASQGAPAATQGEFNLAIVGKGWFAVDTGSETLYTRDGSFSIDISGSNAYLVNQNGYYVLDNEGKKISAEIGTASPTVDSEKLTGKVGVFDFAYPEALTPAASNCYRANDLTGAAGVSAEGKYKILSGYLEQSGVSLPDEMTDLIVAQRGYALSARVVQTADEIEQTVNSLRT